MSSPTPSNPAGPRQVICVTSDVLQIEVEIPVMRLSRTFDGMYLSLNLQEEDSFPGFFPVSNINARVFEKVVDWCKVHKDQPDPVIVTKVFTQKRQWIVFTDYETNFFDVPVSEMLELVMAAHYLDIVGLYECACQAVAAQIKGKQPVEVRRTLRQRENLTEAAVSEILADNPWLECEVSIQEPLEDVPETTYIPTAVLITIFEKLPRADLERLQLVNSQFRDVVLGQSFTEEKSPLRRLDEVQLGAYPDGHLMWSWAGLFTIRQDLTKHLKFCAVQKLCFYEGWVASEELLRSLQPSRAAWKNAQLETAPCFFPSLEEFEFALTEVLLCKEIRIGRNRQGGFDALPESFLRLPAVAGCNRLHVGCPKFSLEMDDIIDWLHGEPSNKLWDDPRWLAVHTKSINGHRDDLIDQLIQIFVKAQHAREYVLRVRVHRPVDEVVWDEEYCNSDTNEKLKIWVEADDDLEDACHVFVERC